MYCVLSPNYVTGLREVLQCIHFEQSNKTYVNVNIKQSALLINRVEKRDIKSDGDGAEKIRRRRDCMVTRRLRRHKKNRRSSSTKFDDAGVYPFNLQDPL